MSRCDYPGCKNDSGYDMEVCDENYENEIVVNFCRQHYVETMLYNGLNPEDEGIELTESEQQEVYSRLGMDGGPTE